MQKSPPSPQRPQWRSCNYLLTCALTLSLLIPSRTIFFFTLKHLPSLLLPQLGIHCLLSQNKESNLVLNPKVQGLQNTACPMDLDRDPPGWRRALARCFWGVSFLLNQITFFFFSALQLFSCFHVPAGMSGKYNRALKRSEWVASGWSEIARHCQEQNKIWGFGDMIISCKARRVTVCQCTS